MTGRFKRLFRRLITSSDLDKILTNISGLSLTSVWNTPRWLEAAQATARTEKGETFLAVQERGGKSGSQGSRFRGNLPEKFSLGVRVFAST